MKRLRMLLGLVFLVGAGVLVVASQATATAPHPEVSESSNSDDGPDVAPPSSEDFGRGVSFFVRSDEFRSLDPDLRSAVLAEAARDPRTLIIEGERRGVTFIVPLANPVDSSGPWTKVDKQDLLDKVQPASGYQIEQLDHDSYGNLVAIGIPIDADDYTINSGAEPITELAE